MPSNIDVKFQKFIEQLGLRRDVAVDLWNADIQTPQELAGHGRDELVKITTNGLLLNTIHPVLQKYVYNITMAKDPYKKAISILKKHTQDSDSDGEEAMDTSPGIVADSTVADATAFVGNTNTHAGQTSGNAEVLNGARRQGGTSFNNRGVRMNIGDHGAVQTSIGIPSRKAKPSGSNTITITGGNFVQSNVMGQGPVTYNNTNTTITTTMDQNMDEDAKKRRARLLNTTLWIDGNHVRTSDIRWRDGPTDYWLDNRITVPPSDDAEYDRHMLSDDVYHIRNPGSGRALILNNIEFQPGSRMETRDGANVDCTRVEQLLGNLNFLEVRRENNKTAAEMKQILKEFAQSRVNHKADMSLVYIGSHGERDAEGNDTFVGSDGVRVKFSEVKEMFSPKNCPGLYNKPKIFLLQFCRQERNGSVNVSAPRPLQTASVSSDAGGFTEESKPQPQAGAEDETRDMDMLCVFATLAGTKAYRDTADGSWFVTAIVRVFKEHAHTDDVLSMLTKVNNSVSVNEGREGNTRAIQVSEVVHTLRRKILFFPGQKL